MTEDQIAAGDPAIQEVRKAIEQAFEPFFTGELDGKPIDPKDMEIQIRSIILATIGAIKVINRSRSVSSASH